MVLGLGLGLGLESALACVCDSMAWSWGSAIFAVCSTLLTVVYACRHNTAGLASQDVSYVAAAIHNARTTA